MESTHKSEILYRLKKIEAAVRRIIFQNEKVETVSGLERSDGIA